MESATPIFAEDKFSTMLNASVSEIMLMPITPMNGTPPTFLMDESAKQHAKIKIAYVIILLANWFFIALELMYPNRLHSVNHLMYNQRQPYFAVNSLP